MSEIVLGTDVPHLRVILQSGFINKRAITVQVEPADLVDVVGELNLGGIIHTAVLLGATYTWTITAVQVAALNNRSSASLSLSNPEGKTLLGRGIVEIRS